MKKAKVDIPSLALSPFLPLKEQQSYSGFISEEVPTYRKPFVDTDANKLRTINSDLSQGLNNLTGLAVQ